MGPPTLVAVRLLLLVIVIVGGFGASALHDHADIGVADDVGLVGSNQADVRNGASDNADLPNPLHPLGPTRIGPDGSEEHGRDWSLTATSDSDVEAALVPDQDEPAPFLAPRGNRRLLPALDHTCATIQSAVTLQLSRGGGEVVLEPVEYDCLVGGPVKVPGSIGVTFRGSCVTTGNKRVCTTVNGHAQSALFVVGTGVYGLKGIVFAHSGVTAIRSAGNLCIDNCTFVDNSGVNGGAIATAGALLLSGTTFRNNYASNVGGAIYAPSGRVSVSNCAFSNNFANGTGGAIYAYSGTSLGVRGCTFNDNTAQGSGGGITTFGAIDITDTSFTGNTALKASGGAVTIAGGGPATFLRTTFRRNAAPLQYGGAIYTYAGPHTLQGVSFQQNSAQIGGAVFSSGKKLTCKDCSAAQNSASYGRAYGPLLYASKALGQAVFCNVSLQDSEQGFGGARIATCGYSGPTAPTGTEALPHGCSHECPSVSEPPSAQHCAAALFPPSSAAPPPRVPQSSPHGTVSSARGPSPSKAGLVIPTDAASFDPGYCPSAYNTCQTPQSPRSRFCCLASGGLSCCHNSNSEPKCCYFGGEQQADLVPFYLTNRYPDGSPGPVNSPATSPSPQPTSSLAPPSPSPSPRASPSPRVTQKPKPSSTPLPAAAASLTSYDPFLRPNRCYTADGTTEFACGGSTPQCCSLDTTPKCCACPDGQC